MPRAVRTRLLPALFIGGVLTAAVSLALAAIIELTFEDLHIPGTQIGDVHPGAIDSSFTCSMCHGNFDAKNEPYATWSGSLMGQAGRDPLFFAQMTLANQDTVNAGYFCMRCHVPMSFTTGHAFQPDGSTLDATDIDGVTCHLCHSMVDPIYKPGISPPEDLPILNALADGPPRYYGNAMFVLDPDGVRRGPRPDAQPPHALIQSPFHTTANFCGTCHEVGNVAVSRQANGTYRYNTLDERPPSEDPHQLFPLERTFSEWSLSEFAERGVDMGGLFGGDGPPTVSSCQDCHMPRTTGSACFYLPERTDLRRHDFAGASAHALDMIRVYTRGDPNVNQDSLTRGRDKAVDMLRRAATLRLSQSGAGLAVRVTNQSGHKLPTGHIEGRRVWINVVFRDAAGTIVREHGHYDGESAEFDAGSTRVYEMRVGLSEDAARLTGLPPGPTPHMALADTIEFDNRIPPRGFKNSAFEGAGAPVVGHAYADGQYWDDASFPIPGNAVNARVRLYYQQVPKEYAEHLRDANTTDHWGNTLYSLWVATGKAAPIEMASATIDLTPPCIADFNHSGGTPDDADVMAFLTAWSDGEDSADVNGSGGTPDDADAIYFFTRWNDGC